MIKAVVYIISVLISVFAVSGINFNNFFKKGHIWEARLFVVVISFIMGYLLAEFIINFSDITIIN
jgi:uncharacterized integral membrane protein (TIGR02327 family)